MGLAKLLAARLQSYGILSMERGRLYARHPAKVVASNAGLTLQGDIGVI
jgi:hypothetical protein